MIECIRLANFKCFANQRFELGNITLLSGLNGTGKSSVLQSLLLLRQSYQQNLLSNNGLALNGELIKLGTGKDVFNEFSEENEEHILFTVWFDGGKGVGWNFEYRAHADVLQWRSRSGEYEELEKSSLLGNNFHYLQAERIGPQPFFPVSDYAVVRNRQLGVHGEYTPYFLSVWGDKNIEIPALACENARSLNLIHQIEAWMQFVSPGIRLEINSYRGIDSVQVSYSYARGQVSSNSYRATNVGFGITYTLPILTAILSSPPGSLLLFENPEAHLHPRGQVRFAELMATAAAHGVQLLIETHSDHILNGIRLAVHSGKIAPEKVKLYYFEQMGQDGELASRVTQPMIDRNGRIDNWPEGFFDEMDNSLTTLLAPSTDRA